MPDYTGVQVKPDVKEEYKEQRQSFDLKPEQTERAMYVQKRLNAMDIEKNKYIAKKRESLMMYDATWGDGTLTNRAKARVVSPLARIFVESKTAEENKAYSEYQLYPVDDEQDAWRAELVMQTIEHVRRITLARSKRQELIRMKNIIGQSAKWKSFRSTTVMMNVTKKVDEFNAPIEWEEKEVPGEGEIFEDVIDVINDFWIDPNATGIHDALDCAIHFRMNHEEAEEVFGGEMFDFEGVAPGADGMVEGIMYFKKPSSKADMFCIYAWSSTGYGVKGFSVGHVKEVYYGGLPDEHKMLPFVTYVNNPTFTHGFFNEISRSATGEAASTVGTVSGKQKFWAYAGDPELIMDLVDLSTSFGRSMFKACDLAGRSWTATAGNFRIDNSRDWEHGDQIVGGMGKIQTGTWGNPNINAYESGLDYIYNLCIQTLGTDPRNLTDTKQKTLGETIAQRETQFTRLDANMDFNQELGEVRDGVITHKLIQQWYTQMKVVRLTGLETEEELKKFDSTEGEHPQTGKPLLGKQYRRIRTDKPMVEMKAGKQKKLKSTDSGTYSFLARPEYIRTSDMDIAVLTKKRAGELQALKAQQLAEAIDKFINLAPLTQPTVQGGKPPINPESLPPIDDLLKEYWKVIGVSGKNKVKGGTEDEFERLKQAREESKAQSRPLSEVTPIEV